VQVIGIRFPETRMVEEKSHLTLIMLEAAILHSSIKNGCFSNVGLASNVIKNLRTVIFGGKF
jgi:hypothetical protein